MATVRIPQLASRRGTDNGALLLLQVPRGGLAEGRVAEQLLAQLYSLLTSPSQVLLAPASRERISLEIAAIQGRIGFYLWVPLHLKSAAEEALYASYNDLHITELADYAAEPGGYTTTLAAEFSQESNGVLPLRTLLDFANDPLTGITKVLSGMSDDEEVWIQLVLRPVSNGWHARSERYMQAVQVGDVRLAGLWPALWALPRLAKSSVRPSDYDQLRLAAVRAKGQKLGFQAALRIMYRGNVPAPQAKLQLQAIASAYSQFNAPYLNALVPLPVNHVPAQYLYQARGLGGRLMLLDTAEAAALFHLPGAQLEAPAVLWAGAQVAEAANDLPLVTSVYREDLSPLGNAKFRGQNVMFGLNRADRGRHVCLIGEEGTGKSSAQELLAISDFYTPAGLALIDMDSRSSTDLLRHVPAERAKDVVYVELADLDHPVAFNPLESLDPMLKVHTASALTELFGQLCGDSWNHKLAEACSYGLLALADYPEATLLDLLPLLEDERWRTDVLRLTTNPEVRDFWADKFTGIDEDSAPALSKIKATLDNPLVRNVLGQAKSTVRLTDIINERRILVVNLGGLLGERAGEFMGSLFMTGLHLTALERAGQPHHKREPFYVYVDAAQKLLLANPETMLSDLRRYGLPAVFAFTPGSTATQMAELVGSLMCFRVDSAAAEALRPYFNGRFTEYDLTHLHDRHFAMRTSVNGAQSPAFTAAALNLPDVADHNNPADIMEKSRLEYTASRTHVEQHIAERARRRALRGGEFPMTLIKGRSGRPANREGGVVLRPNSAFAAAYDLKDEGIIDLRH